MIRELIYLWIFAIASRVVSAHIFRYRFKIVDMMMYPISLTLYIFLTLFAFYLWDSEFLTLSNNSIISSIMNIVHMTGSGIEFDTFIIIELITWVVIIVSLGLPIATIISSILRIFGIRGSGKNIGKGIGTLMACIISKPYLGYMIEWMMGRG